MSTVLATVCHVEIRRTYRTITTEITAQLVMLPKLLLSTDIYCTVYNPFALVNNY